MKVDKKIKKKMIHNYKFIVQYEGTRYQGWQKQESTGNTIQGKLEAILKHLTGQEIQVDGSGRTDAGVHSRGQTANAKLPDYIDPQELMDYFNRYLPEDIAVTKCEEVSERFHSRLNAIRKTYSYRILNTKTPYVFDRRYVYQIEDTIDLDKMRLAACDLLGQHDFKAFTSTKKGKKSTVRTIESIDIAKTGDEIKITYTGDGFLYHMVRILTGTLIEIGTGKRDPGSVKDIINSKQRENAGYLVPAQGLCLECVEYPQ